MKTLRIVFMGTPDFALPSLDLLYQSRHDLAAVVTQPDRPRGRGGCVTPPPVKKWAMAHGVAVLQPKRLLDASFWNHLEQIKPDLVVTVAYGKMLPEKLLQLPTLGCINLHASLLPAYRGAAPIHRAIMEGATRTGVTVIEMVPEMDAGNIILQEELPVHEEETAGELHDRLAVKGAALLLKAVEALAAGTAQSRPQDPAGVSYAPRLRPEDEVLDWSRDALSLYNQIRGLNPWPGAYTNCAGKRLKVWRARIPAQPPILEGDGNAPPGTIICDRSDALFVITGTGPLELLEVQPDGKRIMSAAEFYCGRRFEPGARLGC